MLDSVMLPIRKDNRGDFRRLYNQRKQKERYIRIAVITTISVEVFVLIVFFSVSKGYPLGISIACFLLLLNICAIMIYLTVHDSGINNDPGIVIWWLCCIRIGKKATAQVNPNIQIRALPNFGPSSAPSFGPLQERRNSKMSMSLSRMRGFNAQNKINAAQNNQI